MTKPRSELTALADPDAVRQLDEQLGSLHPSLSARLDTAESLDHKLHRTMSVQMHRSGLSASEEPSY